MKDEELTGKIIGCAYKVHNTLGSGFVESVYQKSMAVEMRRQGLSGVMENQFPFFMKMNSLGILEPTCSLRSV